MGALKLFMLLFVALLASTAIPTANAFSADNHDSFTSTALSSFLKPGIYNDIVDEHIYEDVTSQFSPKWHFDDCTFKEGTENINDLYDRAVDDLNPNSPDVWDATDAFGQVLHPAQDFYAHSNWIGLGKSGLIDDSFNKWTILNPFTTVKGVIIVQGENSDVTAAGYTASRTDKVVTMTNSSGSFHGLISGSTYATDDCPDSVEMGHWDEGWISGSWPPDKSLGESGYGTGLNKDSASRPGFTTARALAIEQTEHEWCRLVNLVKQKHGREGVKFLFDNWVSDEAKAISLCPNADIAFVIDATGSMDDDTGGKVFTAVVASDVPDAILSAFQQILASVSIKIDSVKNTSPRWELDAVSVSGTIANANPTDTVTVEWGDGTSTPRVPLLGNSWGPVNHTYDSAHIGTKKITAKLLTGAGIEIASNSSVVDVQKHSTSLSLDPINNLQLGGSLVASGTLVDTDASVGISGKTINFTGTGVGTISNTITQVNGIYLSSGEALNMLANGLEIQARFAEDDLYFASDSPIQKYDITIPNWLIFAILGIVIILVGYFLIKIFKKSPP